MNSPRTSTVGSWRDVEEVLWEVIPSMGPQWMVKSVTSDRGYMVMLTNGCGLWGEKRPAKYVLNQADEWASCIEAGVAELSKLVLAEMQETATATWENDRTSVTLRISSKLNDMTYSWDFHFTRLSDELFDHHWAMPMLVHFHNLESRLKQMTNELDNKNRQLEELLPDNKKSKNSNKSASKNKAISVETSAEAVLTSGGLLVLRDHLSLYPQIMRNLHNKRNPEDVQKGQNDAKNAISKRPVETKTEEELEQEELIKQQERRAKIQELTQGTNTPTTPQKKKKKKLNI